jgi:hypothetical protein
MTRYRVCYVVATLRERVVKAASEEEARDIVETEMAEAKHHHRLCGWIDDLTVEATSKHEENGCCECSCEYCFK